MDHAGWEFLSATRPLIEGVVRERVRALPGVRFVEQCDVRGLVTAADGSTVTGVRLLSHVDSGAERVAHADLVVDTTGRGSQSGRWLSELGYPAPDEEKLNVGVHYTSRLFRAPQDALDGARSVVVGILPDGRRGATAQIVEGDRWLVTLVGMLGERPPTELESFAEYARQLWAADIHRLLAAATPVGEAVTGAFPAYLRRRYDRLRRFPRRYVVLGDAACSLNPAYAQGMSVAVGEAVALARILDRHGLDRVGQRFFRAARRIVDHAWVLGTGSDLAHAEVDGPRPASWRLINSYLGHALPVAHRDPVVGRALMEVNSLVTPPGRLMHPRVIWRVFRPVRTGTARTGPDPHG